jgi:acetyltransferase (GNAT) family protein
VKIRAARPADRRAILRFLRAEDPQDYVIGWMDLFQASGRFYLLLDGTKVVGVFHGKLAPDGSAWMSAARVNERYRGRGWMMKMNAYAVRTAALRSAHAARMLIVHDNASSLRAAAKGGFKRMVAMSFMEWERPKGARRPQARPPTWRKVGPEEFLKAARGSRLIAAQGGLAYMTFNGAFELNPQSARAARGWLYLSKEHGPLLAAHFPHKGEDWWAIQPFCGGARGARAVMDFADEKRADSFTLFLPSAERWRRPFAASGIPPLDWARRVFIFERRLPWTTSSPGGAAKKRTRR